MDDLYKILLESSNIVLGGARTEIIRLNALLAAYREKVRADNISLLVPGSESGGYIFPKWLKDFHLDAAVLAAAETHDPD